jgi:hypothetical protein
LIFTGYFVHHLLLLLVAWYFTGRAIKRQRRQRRWKSSTPQPAAKKENRVSEPVSVELEIVQEAPTETIVTYVPRQKSLYGRGIDWSKVEKRRGFF